MPPSTFGFASTMGRYFRTASINVAIRDSSSSCFLLSSLELIDTQVYEPEIQALLGTAAGLPYADDAHPGGSQPPEPASLPCLFPGLGVGFGIWGVGVGVWGMEFGVGV